MLDYLTIKTLKTFLRQTLWIVPRLSVNDRFHRIYYLNIYLDKNLYPDDNVMILHPDLFDLAGT